MVEHSLKLNLIITLQVKQNISWFGVIFHLDIIKRPFHFYSVIKIKLLIDLKQRINDYLIDTFLWEFSQGTLLHFCLWT